MAKYDAFTDQELVALLQQSDRKAYEVIYDRYWQLLFRFSRKLLQDVFLAEDVVQEVFTQLWVRREKLAEGTLLAAFLYKLCKNHVLDLVKHSKVELKYIEYLSQTLKQTETLPDRAYIEKELYDLIEREIQNLPAKMRRVFEMSRREYKSNQQIAEELGLSEQTVKNQVSNAIHTLRGKLGDKFNNFLIFF